MATFAELDSNNIVLRVVKADDNDVANNGGEYSDQAAEHFKTVLPLSENGGKWIQCSVNTLGNTHLLGGTPKRKNSPGPGDTYDPVNDGFRITKKPFESWILNPDTFLWEAPVAKPSEENHQVNWNEELQVWYGIKYLENPVDENDIQPVEHWNPNTNSWDSYGTYTPASNIITPN